MKSEPAPSFAGGDAVFARLGRARMLVGAALAASAVIAITAAAALPSAPGEVRVSNDSPAIAPPARDSAAALRAEAVAEPATEPSVRRFTGQVGPDLSRALASAGVPERQGREYIAILNHAIQLADGLSIEDRFDLVLLRNPDGSLGQLVYAGMDRVARADVELMKWTDGKEVIWVNADGVGGEGSQSMGMPVHGRLTSGFGSRFHPILGYRRFHAGLDLAAAAGTPIVAAADGRVVSAGWTGGYGRAVAIAHSSGIETKYGHMSRIATFTGELVHRGDVIGYVGSSGLSTGPHLHFEVLKNGRPVNPQSVSAIAGGPGVLQGAKLAAFHDQLRQVLLGSRS